MAIAKEKGLPLLKHHLLPRSKGFNLIVSQLKGKVDYIYDINLGINDVNGKKPCLAQIKDGIPVFGQAYIRRIPLTDVPIHDEKLCSEFLQKLYREKDEIFDVFDKHGDFSSLGVKKHIIKKNKYDMYITIFWLIITLVPSCYFFLVWFWNGSLLLKLGFTGFITIGNLFLKFFKDMRQKWEFL